MGGESTPRQRRSVRFYCACGNEYWWKVERLLGSQLPNTPDKIECKKCKGTMFPSESIRDMQNKLAEIYQHQ